MSQIFLISCASKKLDQPARAEDLYISPLFKLNLRFAKKSKADKIFILSAKYGLLDLEKIIEPYNITLNNMPTDEVKRWAKKVLIQLSKNSDLQKDKFVFLAGARYRKFLTPEIKYFDVPMAGLGIGRQLKYLKEHL